MKSIMQLVRPQSISVWFLGNEITVRAPRRIARMGPGYVPEERRIFSDLTVLEKIGSWSPTCPSGCGEVVGRRFVRVVSNLKERRGNRGRGPSGGGSRC